MTFIDDGYFSKPRRDEVLPNNIQREVDWIRQKSTSDPVAATEHLVRIVKANPTMQAQITSAVLEPVNI